MKPKKYYLKNWGGRIRAYKEDGELVQRTL
jgi:hypothetical protein